MIGIHKRVASLLPKAKSRRCGASLDHSIAGDYEPAYLTAPGCQRGVLFVLTSPPRPGGNGWQMLAITVAWLAASIGRILPGVTSPAARPCAAVGGGSHTLAAGSGGEPSAAADHPIRGLPALAVILIGWPAGIAAVIYAAFVPGALAGAGRRRTLPWIVAAVLAALAALAALISWSAVNALLELAETGAAGSRAGTGGRG